MTYKTKFLESLKKFGDSQQGKKPEEVEKNTQAYAAQVQEYAPKERWGNIGKWMVGYFLTILALKALAPSVARGAEELFAPSGVDAQALSAGIEDGTVKTAEDLDQVTTEYISDEGNDFSDLDGTGAENITMSDNGEVLFIAEGAEGAEVLSSGELLEPTGGILQTILG